MVEVGEVVVAEVGVAVVAVAVVVVAVVEVVVVVVAVVSEVAVVVEKGVIAILLKIVEPREEAEVGSNASIYKLLLHKRILGYILKIDQ